MMKYKKIKVLALLLVTLLYAACKKQWDERNAVTDQQLDKNLFQQIESNSNLSTFAGYLTKIGYDKVLGSSKTYTVWVPDNQALQGIDPAIVADTAKLRFFVNNHIAYQTYFTNAPKPSLRIRTLNGKNVSFTSTTVEEATITSANQYVRNGVLHVINKPLTPKLNIYEYVKSLTTLGALQKAYLQRMDSTYVDTTLATVASIDQATGKPKLVPGTGIVTRNRYFTRVANLAAEDSTYTYFVLTDDAYTAERSKVSRFFTTVTNSTDTTNMLAGFNVLKDVAVRGLIKPDQLPANLLSVNGVPVPVNKTAIVQTYNASNGIVYVISSMNFKLEDKILPITIEGERPPSFFTRIDRGVNISYRTRVDPNTNISYRELFMGGPDLPANFYAAYKISNLNTCRYRVVWRAINDIVFSVAPFDFQQRVTFGQITGVAADGTATTVVNFPYTRTGVLNYSEVTLTGATVTAGFTGTITATNGTLDVTKYSSVNMYVQGDNIVAGSSGNNINRNAVLLDYIKLIPILQ